MAANGDIAAAVAETIRRQPEPRRFDYQELNRMVRRHKAALTRARNSGDPRRVVVACRDAVLDFNTTMWPDNWPLWQNALQEAISTLLGWRAGMAIDLHELAGSQWADINTALPEGDTDDG